MAHSIVFAFLGSRGSTVIENKIYRTKSYNLLSISLVNMSKHFCLLDFSLKLFKYHVLCTDGKISVRIIYFSTVVPLNSCFLSCRPFAVNAHIRRQKKLQHPTSPVENVALTTKGLQERKHNRLVGRRWKNR